ncbi:unnamed protein product [Linum trigynum]|uniref:Integrase n=1 Tax=Linum trigynum TaxID=586398 RepID=A0AAV2CIF1_9ROSI
MSKTDAKSRLIRRILLLREFDIEIRDKNGVENVAADHLSRLGVQQVENFVEEINESFLYERLLMLCFVESVTLWFSNFTNHLVASISQGE